MRTTRVSVMAIMTLLSVGGTAYAIPIPIPGTGGLAFFEFLLDTPTDVQFRISGPTVVIPLPIPELFVNDFSPASPNWDFTLDLFLRDDPAADRIAVFAEVFHERHPPGDPLAPGGQGNTFGFTFDYRSPLSTLIPPEAVTGMTGALVAHDGHRDRYFDLFFSVSFQLMPPNPTQIDSWEVTGSGRHEMQAIPEPSTLSLFGVGVVSLTFCAWRLKTLQE
jgi:hypothetical protein